VNLGGEEAPAAPPQVAPDPSTQIVTVSPSTVTVVHTTDRSGQAGQPLQPGQPGQPGQSGEPGDTSRTSPEAPGITPPGVTTTEAVPTTGGTPAEETAKSKGRENSPPRPTQGARP
jgi:hypothetical protein